MPHKTHPNLAFIPERIWEQIELTFTSGMSADDGFCWRWIGYCRNDGYAMSWVNGKQSPLHQIFFDAMNPDADRTGLDLDHRCGERRCVNPDHLHVVTRSLNMQNLQGAHKDSKTGYRGVSLDARRGTYNAEVSVEGRRIRKSGFENPEAANEAAIAIRREHMPNSLMDQREAATA